VPPGNAARGPRADLGREGRYAGADAPGTRRVFVAVPLPEPAREDVAALVDAVRSAADPDVRDVRWVRMDGLHLTLRFIGPVGADRIGPIARAVEEAAATIDAFDVTIDGAGAFPSPTRPRTIWLDVTDGAPELAGAAGAVEDALAATGLERSSRPFRAHLTVARSDGIRAGPAVARRFIDAAARRRTAFRATELVLFETRSGGGPARYAPLHTAPLRRPDPLPERRRPVASSVLPSEPSVEPRTSVGGRRKEQGPGT
jgi:RNA 2',3'-cyclic 3'-phosphodiesterase